MEARRRICSRWIYAVYISEEPLKSCWKSLQPEEKTKMKQRIARMASNKISSKRNCTPNFRKFLKISSHEWSWCVASGPCRPSASSSHTETRAYPRHVVIAGGRLARCHAPLERRTHTRTHTRTSARARVWLQYFSRATDWPRYRQIGLGPSRLSSRS